MKKNNRLQKKRFLSDKKNKLSKTKLTKNNFVHLVRTHKRLKQALVAICSSLVLGLTFGLIFLSMVKQEEPPSASTLHLKTTDTETVQTEKQVESLQFYVVQAGVFTEEVNANKWGEQFTALAYPAVTWERDDQYFVLTGLALSETAARKQAEQLVANDLDVFVKQWEITAKHDDWTDVDVQYIRNFLDVWHEAVDSGVDISIWGEVTDVSGISKEMSTFNEKIEQKVDGMVAVNKVERLLEMINAYDKLHE